MKEILQKELFAIQYKDETHAVEFHLDGDGETVWASREKIAELFDIDRSVVSKHLKGIFESKEVDEQSNVQKMHIANSTKPVEFFSLDVIISVGYRVNSRQATKFRQWATTIIKQYVIQGYALNEQRLRNDSIALTKLAHEVRKLRTEEKNIYEAVRKSFSFASDYNPKSEVVSQFYGKLQNAFYTAICGLTADEIRLLADANSFKMNAVGAKILEYYCSYIYIIGNYLYYDEMYAKT